MKDKVDIRCPYCMENDNIEKQIDFENIQIYKCNCGNKFRVELEIITYPVYCGKWE